MTAQDQPRTKATSLNDVTTSSQSFAHHARFITLIRHGRTSYNAQQRLQGQVDIALDEVGAWQVQQTAQDLKKLYVDSEQSVAHQLIVSSPLTRAQQSAQAFAGLIGAEIHTDERVQERSFGDLEGISVSEMQEKWPEDFESWRNFGDGDLKHGAEPKPEVGSRGAAAINEWAHQVNSDTELFVFSHGAWINQTLQTLMGWCEFHTDFADIVSMRNAFWTRLMLFDMPDGSERYRLVEYAHGPQAAYSTDWDNPTIA